MSQRKFEDKAWVVVNDTCSSIENRGRVGIFNQRPDGYQTLDVAFGCEHIMFDPADLRRFEPYRDGSNLRISQ